MSTTQAVNVTKATTTTKARQKSPPVIDAAFVLARRKQLGQNQSQFWRPLGVTQSGGSRYESGRAIPAPTRKLIYLLHVANLPDWVVGDIAKA